MKVFLAGGSGAIGVPLSWALYIASIVAFAIGGSKRNRIAD